MALLDTILNVMDMWMIQVLPSDGLDEVEVCLSPYFGSLGCVSCQTLLGVCSVGEK
jgi:hypothetical protein